MSFWLGIILGDRVILACDRKETLLGGSQKKYMEWGRWEHWYYTREHKPKFTPIGNQSFFIKSGELQPAENICKIISDYWAKRSITFQELKPFRHQLQTESIKIWSDYMADNKKVSEQTGIIPRVECAWGGLFSGGRPFLVNIFNENDFWMKIQTAPGEYNFSPLKPENDQKVRGDIRRFLDLVIRESEAGQKISSKILPRIIDFVSKVEPGVGPLIDLIIISKIGVETSVFYKCVKINHPRLVFGPILLAEKVREKIENWVSRIR